jgi:cytochrome c oxidase cbb3-type subunit III
MSVASLSRRALGVSFLLAGALLSGCHSGPEATHVDPEVPRPELVRDFATLYTHNCSGCHGSDGENGPAIDLANPVFQATIDDANLRRLIVNGEAGTEMPAFGQSAGGQLTDAQIDALVQGMRARWQKPGLLNGQNPPPFAADKPGDAAHGQQVYTAYCASCHGSGVKRGPKASSVLDPSFLALVSDPAMRSIIVAGRPDLGMPDWRHQLVNQPDVAQPGHPMSDQEVTDVVTWIASQRSQTPGQPYP